MLALLAKLLAGPLIGKLLDAFSGWQQRKLSRDEMAKELEALLAHEANELAKTQADVVMAEAKGEDWLQRNWRPVTSLLFVFIVFRFGWLQPATVAWFNWPPLRVGDTLLIEILGLVKLCLGGYIGGRTLEKVFKR